MSVKKDASGRRSVAVETEVPGTPEEVWQAIATGPGISSWFVPTEFQERDGVPVTLTMHFGPGMDDVARVTAWDPPRRYSADSDGLGPNAPTLATEWIVEARSGGACLVRVVQSLFADTDDWDSHLESMEGGWSTFFRILNIYLRHFRGQRATTIRVMSVIEGSPSQAWNTLTAPLNLAGATPGQRWTASGDLPLSGFVEPRGPGVPEHTLLLRIDEPGPGIVSVFAHTDGKQVYVGLDVLLYGEDGAATAARVQPQWQEWLNTRFPVGKLSSV
jgi:uncharacterized protein YndB with AHSA1/START domain